MYGQFLDMATKREIVVQLNESSMVMDWHLLADL